MSAITVSFINNVGFIFSGEGKSYKIESNPKKNLLFFTDYMTLRKSYRIIGNFAGSSLMNSRSFSHKGNLTGQ